MLIFYKELSFLLWSKFDEKISGLSNEVAILLKTRSWEALMPFSNDSPLAYTQK